MFLIKSRKSFLKAASLIAVVLIMAVVVCCLPAYEVWAYEQDASKETKRTLHVTGEGRVSVAPDVAYVTLGVTTEHEDAATAQLNNTKAMDKVIKAVKEAGIEDKDLQTVGYRVYPKYNYIRETGENEIIGYTVSNSVKVTIRDVSKVGEILDTASKNGANSSGGISFGLSDYEKHYNEALKNAVQAAKKKAGVLAAAAGVNIGTPVTISESGGYNPRYISIGYGMESAMDDARTAQAPVPIEAGTYEVTAYVSLVYEY